MEREWTVAFHEEFDPEFERFSVSVQQMILARAELLRKFGPQLGRPHVDTLKGSRHTKMKELRFSAGDGVWRVAFAFDLKRRAILLVAGDKSGMSQDKFYRNLIGTADRRFDQHQLKTATEREEL
jgi:hypothetical protein